MTGGVFHSPEVGATELRKSIARDAITGVVLIIENPNLNKPVWDRFVYQDPPSTFNCGSMATHSESLGNPKP